MAYVQSFKKFLKDETVGANPVVAEQAAPTTAPTPANATQQPSTTPPPAPASVEANPAVIAARSALATATANKDKAIAAKEAELEKVKADQALQVNNATTALNNALQKAATSK